MLTFRFLTPNDHQALHHCFLEAFQSYFVPMSPTLTAFDRRLRRMGVSLGWSAGAFKDDKLVGFILTGIGEFDRKQTAYNAGTGILPEFRQQGLGFELYQWLIQELRNGLPIDQFLLEVIEENRAALRLYEKLGFRVTRYLKSYQIRRKSFARPRNEQFIRVVSHAPDWEQYRPFAAFSPYWGNDFPALARGFRLRDYCLEYRTKEGQLKGFLQGEVSTGKVSFWGTQGDYRVAKELFKAFAWFSPMKEITVLNVPAKSEQIRASLRRWGGTNYLNQYEMHLTI